MDRNLTVREQRMLAAGFIVLLIVGYAALVPHRGNLSHFDHAVYQQTVLKMHRGEGFYDAFTDASREAGALIERARAFRLPTAFLLWRALPPDHLYIAYLVLVVGVSSLLALFLTETPLVAVGVAFYLLCAGRLPGTSATAEEFLLNELWAVPFVFGGLLLWKHQRWWPAAITIGAAVITREVAAPLLIGGLIAAHRRGLPRRPWIVVSVAAAGLYLLHLHVASSHLVAHGNDAKLVGTGHPPGTILDMMDWVFPSPSIIGLVLWALAVARVRQIGQLDLLGPFLLIPITGLVVARPYWGLLFIPLVVLFALELVASTIMDRGAPPGAGAEGSWPPRRTRWRGRGTPEAVRAPPSARS